jgi:hypothetical protein
MANAEAFVALCRNQYSRYTVYLSLTLLVAASSIEYQKGERERGREREGETKGVAFCVSFL